MSGDGDRSKRHGLIRDVPAWALEDHAGAKLPEEIASSVAGGPRAGSPPLVPLLTVGETATLLHVASRTIRRMIKRGEIDAVKIGGSVRIRPKDIQKIIVGD